MGYAGESGTAGGFRVGAGFVVGLGIWMQAMGRGSDFY